MDFYTAKRQFNNYLKDYDCHNDKIRLKIVHTYGVVKESTDISARMQLSEEDTTLAKMIALLHDIGRFEQLKQFDSFLPDTMDHAAYGVKILFDNAPHQNLIRNFIPESDFDQWALPYACPPPLPGCPPAPGAGLPGLRCAEAFPW